MRAAVVALAICACEAQSQEAQPPGETLYVIEQLIVGVNSASDGSGDRVGQIQSGDRVEVLERQGETVCVKLGSGEEGWVKASYLSSNPPLREQLKSRNDELDKLRQEKAKLEADLTQAKRAAEEAKAAASRASKESESSSATMAKSASGDETDARVANAEARDLAREHEFAEGGPATGAMGAAAQPPSNPPLFADEGVLPARPSWILAAIASVLALALGFALGWRMLDRRIRAKYGGLRIY